MSTPGATELLIVLVIVLLVLGPKRLPSLGRQLGGGLRELRRSLGGGDAQPDESGSDAPAHRETGGAERPDTVDGDAVTPGRTP